MLILANSECVVVLLLFKLIFGRLKIKNNNYANIGGQCVDF